MNNRHLNGLLTDQSGALALVTGLVMTVLMGFAALAFDLSHLYTVRTELQRVVDAAARAGARGLRPAALPLLTDPPSDPNCANGAAHALEVATNAFNKVDTSVVNATDVTVDVGQWNYTTHTFAAGCTLSVNGVRVTAVRRDISLFFASILGRGPVTETATSTAVMDWAKGVGKGTLPIAINKRYVKQGTQLYINFTPDPLDDGGWFADPPASASAKTFRDYIDNASCPPLNVGDLINLQNGNDSGVLNDLANKLADRNGNWLTFLPIVDCDRFNGNEPIIGFCPFNITNVDSTSQNKGVYGTVMGVSQSDTADPGGENYGVLSVPRAVN
jgi:Flp pilus assembly protein TadG